MFSLHKNKPDDDYMQKDNKMTKLWRSNCNFIIK